MNQRRTIDFAQLANALRANEIGKGGVTIRSGECAEADARDLLQAWRAVANMPYGLWEELSAVRVDRAALPIEVWSLLRGRMFGAGGDFDLWRAGKGFAWRFVGLPQTPIPPDPRFQGIDFWQQPGNEELGFFRSEATYLLWGKSQGNGEWSEDRVAAAHLRYPLPANAIWERVQVHTVLYSRGGQVEFVWHQELEGYHG